MEWKSMALRIHRTVAGLVAAAVLAVSTGSAGEPAQADKPVRLKSVANPDAFYPSGARHRGERGAPVVEVCVGPDGHLVSDPVVAETSGFPELDEAAVKVAKANRYSPASSGGTPLEESCIKFRVKFG